MLFVTLGMGFVVVFAQLWIWVMRWVSQVITFAGERSTEVRTAVFGEPF